MSAPGNFDGQYTRYQLERGRLRRIVRKAYLRKAASLVQGATLDFGCGVGELLRLLPPGSHGVEYNLDTVAHCRNAGLPVSFYDGFQDDWGLDGLADFRFDSMILSHVLEHLDSPMRVLSRLSHASARLGVEHIVVIVPGAAGYAIDATHKTFVDEAMLRDEGVLDQAGLRVSRLGYFPGNLRPLGNWFPHHELQVVFERR